MRLFSCFREPSPALTLAGTPIGESRMNLFVVVSLIALAAPPETNAAPFFEAEQIFTPVEKQTHAWPLSACKR
jgi:hypothetical protein